MTPRDFQIFCPTLAILKAGGVNKFAGFLKNASENLNFQSVAALTKLTRSRISRGHDENFAPIFAAH